MLPANSSYSEKGTKVQEAHTQNWQGHQVVSLPRAYVNKLQAFRKRLYLNYEQSWKETKALK